MLIFIVQDRQHTLSPSHHLALYSKRLEASRETKINLYYQSDFIYDIFSANSRTWQNFKVWKIISKNTQRKKVNYQ